MLVKSHKEPKKVELRKKEGKVNEYFLRKNISSKEITNEQETTTMYEYEEVKIKLVERNNILDYINNNFEDLFQIGITEENTPEPPSKQERIDELENTLMQLLGV